MNYIHALIRHERLIKLVRMLKKIVKLINWINFVIGILSSKIKNKDF
jgi:hypothetical protein